MAYSNYIGYVDESPYMGHSESKGVFNPDEVRAMFPMDEVLGYPQGDLARIMDKGVSESEKEKIMNRLHRQESSYFANMSDDDIIDIVPPRYIQDQTDIQRWRDYLSVYVLPNMSESTANKIIEAVGDDTDTSVDTDSNNDKTE